MNRTPHSNARALLDAMVDVLNQGETLLTEINDGAYVRKLPGAFDASIGEHYRHCLDHFRSLLGSTGCDGLNYDHRERGTLVENDRFAALNATRALRQACEQLTEVALLRPLNVTCKTSCATHASQSAPSTVGREVMYVVAHAVHHYALIGIMAGMQGLPTPAGFGVAPSTLKHQAEADCAAARG